MIPRRRSSRRERTRAWCAMRRSRRRRRQRDDGAHGGRRRHRTLERHRRIRPRMMPSSTTCDEPQSARTQCSNPDRWRPDAARQSARVDARLYGRLHRPRAARAARGRGRVVRRPPHRVDGHAAAVRRARRAGRGVSRAGREVRVIVPDTGSAYGGKHTGETAIEAARLARAAGRPVKVCWTRAEEFTWAYVRPAGGDRRPERRRPPTGGLPSGRSTRSTPEPPASAARTRSRTSGSHTFRPRRRSGKAPTAGWQPPSTTSRVKPTSMPWRRQLARTKSSSVCGTFQTRG